MSAMVGQDPAWMRGSVLVVLVLYRRRFSQVPCHARLRQWLTAPVDHAESAGALRIRHGLVYDNSPHADPELLADPAFNGHVPNSVVTYRHDPDNGGTRGAYLCALDAACRRGDEWILLLDHDTDLPDAFLLAAEHALSASPAADSVGAVVPRVRDRGVWISPSRITVHGRVTPWVLQDRPADSRTPVPDHLTAIASASLVRTSSLEAMLPVPAAFQLDYLDHWVFRQLLRQGASVAVSSAIVEHSLSVMDLSTMNVQRYRSILLAEWHYLRDDPRYSVGVHLSRLVLRTLKLAFSAKRPDLVRVCFSVAREMVGTVGAS
ncbi:hypothetical protein [uncultured Sphaerotilus sp.]|uniref:hypothetical protein n=1 Tax=uncultured Sphaerotilus sp. TaxID=474984 RepID=UPI0030CA20FE